jgi:hypothetical protein
MVMIKTVGRRRVDGGTAGDLHGALAAVRGTGAVVSRGVYRFTIALLIIFVLPLSAQDAKQKPPKKGDTIVVRGCLRGNAVEQADLMIEDAEGEARENSTVPALTYRLQGDKALLKELKDRHDHKVVQVKGILRSELSGSGIGTTVGRTRITIGADPRNPTRGAEQQLPVLDAKSFEPTTITCGK